MNQYMEMLRHHSIQREAEKRIEQAAAQQHQPPPPLDYVGILTSWWNSMAPAVRQHPWSLEVVAQAAFSNQPRKPALRRVADALRALGFNEHRDWTRAGRNRRCWQPPSPSK